MSAGGGATAKPLARCHCSCSPLATSCSCSLQNCPQPLAVPSAGPQLPPSSTHAPCTQISTRGPVRTPRTYTWPPPPTNTPHLQELVIQRLQRCLRIVLLICLIIIIITITAALTARATLPAALCGSSGASARRLFAARPARGAPSGARHRGASVGAQHERGGPRAAPTTEDSTCTLRMGHPQRCMRDHWRSSRLGVSDRLATSCSPMRCILLARAVQSLQYNQCCACEGACMSMQRYSWDIELLELLLPDTMLALAGAIMDMCCGHTGVAQQLVNIGWPRRDIYPCKLRWS